MEPPVVRAAFVVVGIARGFTHEPVWRSILENGVERRHVESGCDVAITVYENYIPRSFVLS